MLFMRIFSEGALHRNGAGNGVSIMPTWSSLLAPKVVVMTAAGADNAYYIGINAALGFLRVNICMILLILLCTMKTEFWYHRKMYGHRLFMSERFHCLLSPQIAGGPFTNMV